MGGIRRYELGCPGWGVAILILSKGLGGWVDGGRADCGRPR